MVIDRATDPSIVKIARAEYEIPRQFRLIPQKITGNKFVLAGENFADPKVKNHPQYLRSLGVDPDHYIPIVEGPGYTQYGYMMSYGELNRMYLTEASPFQLTLFLSDPFTFEE